MTFTGDYHTVHIAAQFAAAGKRWYCSHFILRDVGQGWDVATSSLTYASQDFQEGSGNFMYGTVNLSTTVIQTTVNPQFRFKVWNERYDAKIRQIGGGNNQAVGHIAFILFPR